MCNHYANIPEARTAQTNWREFIGWSLKAPVLPERLALEEDVWPRREAAVVRSSTEFGGAFVDIMRWGIPLSLPGKRPGTKATKHVTNVRNLESPFWRGILVKPEQRCLVPFTRFAEPVIDRGKAEHWFDIPSQPLAAFAGIWRLSSTVRPGPVAGRMGQADFFGAEPQPTAQPAEQPEKLFAFLTCEPNPLIAPLHPKAMPVILHPADYQTWLSADWEEAKALVQPFPSQLMGVG